MNSNIEFETESVINKIKHYLITTMGRSSDAASDEEFYRAFSWALREEVMINWTATNNTIQKEKVRKLYYISMEYMPGRLLGNNLTNISAIDLVKSVLKSMNRDFHVIMSIEPEIGIGNGGLGRLASCFMDSLATLQYPALGYGMRYQYGIFEQELWCGIQIERPECWLLLQNPWEFRRDSHSVHVEFAGRPCQTHNKFGEEVYDIVDSERVRALPYDLPIIGYNETPNFSVLTLRLWSTKESPRNFQLQRYNAGQLEQAGENTSLTDVLYPNDNNDVGKRIRLKQEFLLVSASLQDIINQHLKVFNNMTLFSDKVRIQINDTHPALVIAELMRLLLKEHNYNWKEAWETVQTVVSYTNHTVLKEALEEWNEERLFELLPRQYNLIKKLNDNLCKEVREKFPNDEEKLKRLSIIDSGQVRMANLAIYGSHTLNGVARLHSQILKDWMFKDFHDLYPDKFTNVTNGVTQRRWLLYCNPKLSEFISNRIGKKWITNFEEIKRIAEFASDEKSQKEFLDIKKANKKALIGFLLSDPKIGLKEREGSSLLTEDALFDIHIKRFHEYKRQFMNALHALMLYHEIKANPNARKIKRVIFFGGKAAPGYKLAKDIIRFIYCLSRKISQDLVVKDHLSVIFVPNYNVSKAEKLIPAADLSEQISTAGMEASGTGNMKLSMNGALTIGTDDGANIEMREHVTDQWWPFKFGASAAENTDMLNNKTYDPKKICESNPKIKQTIESLVDGTLVENDAEAGALNELYQSIMSDSFHHRPDRYFVLNDLQSYYETQKKVEDLYIEPNKWAEYALHNMAGMGYFSADVSIKNYAERIWDLKPCVPSSEELSRIKKEYTDLDRCRILPHLDKAQ